MDLHLECPDPPLEGVTEPCLIVTFTNWPDVTLTTPPITIIVEEPAPEIDPCEAQPGDLVIDPTIVTDPMPTEVANYRIGDPALTMSLDPSKVSSSSTTCPAEVSFVTIVCKGNVC